jgi:hypothetical protein
LKERGAKNAQARVPRLFERLLRCVSTVREIG